MITHDLLGLAGSVTKLEILNQKQLLALNNIAANGSIAYGNISISGSWEQVELTPEAGYKLKAADTDNGPMQTMEVNGVMMNDDAALFTYLYNRYVLLVTDGNGKRFLFGNLTENLKMEYDIDSRNSRSVSKITTMMFKGATISAVLVVL